MADPSKAPTRAPAHEVTLDRDASAQAPFLYVDAAPSYGFNDGIVRVTLVAARMIPVPGPIPETDLAIVGHLRMGLDAARSLRDALDRAIQIGESPPMAVGKPN